MRAGGVIGSDGVRVTGTAYVRVVVRITDSDRGKLTWLGLGLVCVCADVGLGVVVCACAHNLMCVWPLDTPQSKPTTVIQFGFA